jgi:hypothetical protein
MAAAMATMTTAAAEEIVTATIAMTAATAKTRTGQ